MARRVREPDRLTPAADTAGPVFVLGAPQSGATAIAWALAQHPALRTLHGARWMTKLCLALASVEAEGRRVDRTRSTITTIGHLAQRSVGPDRFWQSFADGIGALLGSASLDGDLAGTNVSAPGNGSTPSGAAPQRWVSAEPELDRIVHALALLFPDARFVHVVRSPEGAVAAMCTRSRGNPHPLRPTDAAARWAEAVGNGLDAEAALGDAVVRLEHQRMVADPRGAIERCLDLLGLPWEEGCLRPLRGALGSVPDARAGTVPRTAEIDALVRQLMSGGPAPPSEASEARQRLAGTLWRHAGIADAAVSAPAAVQRCRALVESCVPRGASVAVVTRGDDALLELTGIEGHHFPQTDGGAYLGHHPADSEEATARLEAVRGRGVGYLVVPRASFWWLDHYVGLREHLLGDCHVVGHHVDVGIVFGLERTAPGRQVLTFGYTDREAEAGAEPSRALGANAVDGDAPRLGRLFSEAADQFVAWEQDVAVVAPEGWPVRQLGRWQVSSHPQLPVRELQDRTGQRIGWLLGEAVAARVDAGNGPVSLDLDIRDGPHAFEAVLYGLGGRWATLVDAPWGARLHLDAGGTLAAVHGRDRQVIASTTSLLQAVMEGPDFERPGITTFPADGENQFFPGGLTHLPWARRVLPNHHLDLRDWVMRRHWPAGDIPIVDDRGLVTQLQRISSGLGSVLAGLATSRDLHLGLTAGRDSRLLLACGRGARESIATFTFDYGTAVPGAAVDIVLARELAGIAGVPHQVLPVTEPREEERRAYLFAIGHAGHWGKARDRGAARRHLKPSGALVSGFLGGLGRGHYWTGMPMQVDALSPELLVERLGLPATGPFVAAMRAWRDRLPEISPRLLLDLLYLEHRGGSWAGPHLYGTARFGAVVVPYAHREVLDAMFRLPYQYRRQKLLYEDLVRMAWPELLDLPFQRLPEHTT